MVSPRLVAVGDNDLDCYEHLGEAYPGGNCLNVAVFARRFGASSEYIGRIGDDRAGQVIRDALLAEGVGTERLLVVSEPTAWCRIGLRNGERYFIDNELGASRFTPVAEDFNRISGADAVHVGASSALDDCIPKLAQLAPLSYDFAACNSQAHIESLAPYAFLSTHSGSELDSDSVEQLAALTLRSGSEWVLVTQGSEGAMLAHGSERWNCSAVSVDVVDTLGAGDTFLSRVLVGLLRDEEPQRILDSAALEAARTCSRFGAFGHGTELSLHDRSGHPVSHQQ